MQVVKELSDKFEGISLLNCLEAVDDPRIDRQKLYPLNEVLLIALCAMLSGCEGFRAFAIYGEEKLGFLKRIYPYNNGVPSHDTFARIFSLLCSKQFSVLLTTWVEGLRHTLGDLQHIAIDGKSLRGSRKAHDKHSAIHLVSAFASETRLTLAQEKAPHKGYGENEALIKILGYLNIQGATITIDAAGCRIEVAQALVNKKAEYILGLKKNQKNAHEAVLEHFGSEKLLDEAVYFEEATKGHGRIELRKCWVTEDLRCLAGLPEWPNIKSIVCIESERHIKTKTTTERRYYLSSLEANAAKTLKIIRSHWAIENSLHWVLDVTFSEDGCRARTKNAPENMSILRRMVANVLQKIKRPGESLRGLRIRAGANEEKLLNYVTQF